MSLEGGGGVRKGLVYVCFRDERGVVAKKAATYVAAVARGVFSEPLPAR